MGEEKKKIYIVKSIIEPDFGCEGRPEGCEPMDQVILEAPDGQNRVVIQSDARLYEMNIEEGDRVCLEGNILRKLQAKHKK